METKQLDNATAELVRWITEQAQNAASFAQSEVPELVSQLLTYRAITSIVGLCVTALACFLFYFSARKIQQSGKMRDWKQWRKEHPDSSTYHYPGKDPDLILAPMYVLYGISGVVFLILISSIAESNAMQIWIAPKLYLLEYAKTLL